MDCGSCEIDFLGGLCLGNVKPVSDGVVGCEPARALERAAVLIRSDVSMSETEMACDRLCICPRGGPLTGGGRYSLLPGLVLTSGEPSFPPPTNSLPRRRWPRPAEPGMSGKVDRVGLGVAEDVVLPKVKVGRGAGRAERLTRCWFRAISCKTGCVGLEGRSCGSSAPGLKLKFGRGGGGRAPLAPALILSSANRFSFPSSPCAVSLTMAAPGLKENAGRLSCL